MVIDHKLYQTSIVPVLDKLAKRYNPESKHWHNMFNCLVCGADVFFLNNIKRMEHGINHLKEHNLLPFI